MPAPAVSGLRVRAPASLIETPVFVITVIIGIVLSVLAYFVVNHLSGHLAQQHREREMARLTQLAGQQLRLLTHQALITTHELALRLRIPPTSRNHFDTLVEETLKDESSVSGLLRLRQTAAGVDPFRVVKTYPTPNTLDISLADIQWPIDESGKPVIVTMPAATRPNSRYALVLARLNSVKTGSDWIATVIDFDWIHGEIVRSLEIDQLQLRIYDAAESAEPRPMLHSPGIMFKGLSHSEEALIGNKPWLLETTATSSALGTVTDQRSAWIALFSGLLLTLIALSYLTVLRRHALLFAKMQQKLGKKLAHQARQEVERDLRLKK